MGLGNLLLWESEALWISLGLALTKPLESKAFVSFVFPLDALAQ